MTVTKVSFDFDDCLSEKEVQDYAQSLVDRGIEVWITTRRLETSLEHPNIDLKKVAKKLGIPDKRITFMGMQWKYVFLKNSDFIWHIDDDIEDLKRISAFATTGIKCILYTPRGQWRGHCERFINLNS